MADVLVLDTCGERGYVAVVSTAIDGGDPRSERRLEPRSTQEQLLPAVREVLAQAAVSLEALCGIAVVHGPGSFTGVRIGLAAAKGLCEAASLPLMTLSRLTVLANAVEPRPVWAWLQAGRGDVYVKGFDAGGFDAPNEPHGVDEFAEGRVCSLAEAIAAAGQNAVAVCEETLWHATPATVPVNAAAFERAVRACAASAVREERWSDVALSDALYLRVPDAELALRARQG